MGTPIPERYGPGEAAAILAAYRRLFPVVPPALAAYWGWDRPEPWAWLTTDFHRAAIADLEALDAALAGPPPAGHAAHAAWLRDAARAAGVGLSFGVSPWTDDLLLRTAGPGPGPGTRRLVLVVGHDWHPIVHDGGAAASPWVRDSLRTYWRYARAVPEDRAVLFVNLYPHFRPPSAPTTGRLPVSYAALAAGLDALVGALDAEVAGVVSWGAPVWEALRGRAEPPVAAGSAAGSAAGLTAGLTAAVGRRLTLRLGGRTLPYAPFLHPSAYGFGTPAHLAAYRAFWASLQGGGG